jgi:hypothetical protein
MKAFSFKWIEESPFRKDDEDYVCGAVVIADKRSQAKTLLWQELSRDGRYETTSNERQTRQEFFSGVSIRQQTVKEGVIFKLIID